MTLCRNSSRLADDVLFGDVWERKELSSRDRSLITVAVLIAGGNSEQLPFHLNKAKANGLTETERKRGYYTPGVLRWLAKGHVRPLRRQAGLRRRVLSWSTDRGDDMLHENGWS